MLINPHQLQAGERLRSDFTRAQLMPRTTSDWTRPIASGRRAAAGKGVGMHTEMMIAARQRVRRALDAVGPEFAGMLLDILRERNWLAALGKDRPAAGA
jgi:hypothetical protein